MKGKTIAALALTAALAAGGVIAQSANAQPLSARVEVPRNRLPPRETKEIAQYAAHLTWVDSLTNTAGQRVDVVLDRFQGRTYRLPIDPIRDLDLGLGRNGWATAVYVRCTPSCDIWRYEFARGREQRLGSLSQAGVSERLPTIWGSRIAFGRRGSVVLSDSEGKRPRTVAHDVLPDDIELGAKQLAYVGLYEGEGNGTVELHLRGLASGRERVVAEGTIGEATSVGFGALTFNLRTLFWQARRRNACHISAPLFWRYVVRGGRGEPERVGETDVPMSVQRATITPPGTPESDDC